jgi:hypothetical protein
VCTEVSFPGVLLVARGDPNLKKLTVGQERDMFRTVQTENYSNDGHRTTQLFCA